MSSRDLAWEPPPWQARFRHAWPSQWQTDSGVWLIPCQGYNDTVYHHEPHIQRLADSHGWQIPDHIDSNQWDSSWHPDYREPAFEYHFGTQWQPTGGPVYRGDCGIKIMDHPRAVALPDPTSWVIPTNIDLLSWDLSWHPDSRDPGFRYEFGTQWHDRGGPVYHAHHAQTKFMAWPRANTEINSRHWRCMAAVESIIDQSWVPHPDDPPYIYVFGNQWWPAEVMPTWEYHVPGASQKKFMQEPRAQIKDTQPQRWQELHHCTWDQTWCPDPGDPPYIYVFGNQWWSAEVMPTVEYHVPGATLRKYVTEPRATLCADRTRWSVPDDVDDQIIDYSWCPDPGSPPYIYHFGSGLQDAVGITYSVPGATDIKISGDVPTIQEHSTVMIQQDIFYIDFHNSLSSQRLRDLQHRLPQIQRVRYVNSLMDTLRRCHQKAKTPNFWVISSHNNYNNFDFSWHPEIWQRGMIHVFGTQWNKWSTTFLINKSEFQRQQSWQSDLSGFYNLNFVSGQQVVAATDASEIIMIDHGNDHSEVVKGQLSGVSGRILRVARYFDNYLDTLKRVVDSDINHQHVWVCSSLCDYSDFDFSWQPEAWQQDMLHVFASDGNKFGDTFLVPVKTWCDQQYRLQLLEWFDTVNYVPDISVPRWPLPVIHHDADTHVTVLAQHQWHTPLVIFTNRTLPNKPLPAVSIWRDNTKTVVPLDPAAGIIIAPRETAANVRQQIYDYAYIDNSHRDWTQATSQDIVFISYDEPQAQENWQSLHDRFPQAKRLHGVTGIERAKRKAAELSETPWFFAVFAKTQLDPNFVFDFQPDYLQNPKHYIFHCINDVNGLEYGHMGIVMYNRAMILAHNDADQSLDYTLSFPHEVVPQVSCRSRFNTTPYHTWRTAFRETCKLAYWESLSPSIEGAYRLRVWTSHAQGQHAEWCLRGANDGVEFAAEAGNSLDQLHRSFEWQWLRQRFCDRYGDLD